MMPAGGDQSQRFEQSVTGAPLNTSTRHRWPPDRIPGVVRVNDLTRKPTPRRTLLQGVCAVFKTLLSAHPGRTCFTAARCHLGGERATL